jgi:hypothetical protein
VISLPSGPLAAQVPGGLTRWLAVPWQTDTASCRSGYLKTYDPYLPTFWPARVPNQVLTEDDYDIIMDDKRPLGERLAAFANRAAWTRLLGSKSYTDQINNMIEHYGNMGVVEQRDGPGGKNFPEVIEVEDLAQHSARAAQQKQRTPTGFRSHRPDRDRKGPAVPARIKALIHAAIRRDCSRGRPGGFDRRLKPRAIVPRRSRRSSAGRSLCGSVNRSLQQPAGYWGTWEFSILSQRRPTFHTMAIARVGARRNGLKPTF